jgi:DNA-binding transcriptional LysR family regulator
MKSFTQISTFIEVVNRGSFAKAAKHLKISPAAVSKQIVLLEQDVGILLLHRSTRRLDLTTEGQLYFEHAKRIIEACNEADAAISQSKEEPSGTLKVICGPHFGNKYIIPNLREFLDRYPKVDLVIEFTQVIPNLEKEKIDIVIGLSTWIPDNCIQRSLIFARKVVCASPSYLNKYGVLKTPSELIQHRLITHTMSRPNDVLTFKNGESVRVPPILHVNDTRAMRACALEGIGIVEMHDYIVSDDLKSGKLIEILSKFSEQKKTIPLYVAYPQTSYVHIKVRKFIDFVLEKIRLDQSSLGIGKE